MRVYLWSVILLLVVVGEIWADLLINPMAILRQEVVTHTFQNFAWLHRSIDGCAGVVVFLLSTMFSFNCWSYLIVSFVSIYAEMRVFRINFRSSHLSLWTCATFTDCVSREYWWHIFCIHRFNRVGHWSNWYSHHPPCFEWILRQLYR